MDKPVNDLFLRACRREPVERTPIWLMRQAGRYMPQYQQLRKEAGDFISFYKNVDLSVKATLLPKDLLGVDALIIFSDILTPLEAVGVEFEFREGEGPVFKNPINTPEDILKLKPFDQSQVWFVGEIIKGVNRASNRELPTIGFCGAPFTLAAYMIEGRTSKDFKKAKAFMYNYPDAFKELLDKLADMLILYLNFQIESGADAVQIFDSWGGYLSPEDYKEFALPPINKIIKGIRREDQPVIHFTKGVAGFFEYMITSGADVYGIDWMMDIGKAKEMVKGQFAIQGNLDPTVLYADKGVIRKKALEILDKWGKDTGHIFNLGHGLMPDMDMEKVKYLVQVVKEESWR
ncbi:MAG: uroporphyrinogen decarboxylase [Aquificae bacterium]|nr:uroporphyrinogen decarboxylase [Aquificota bacterium]